MYQKKKTTCQIHSVWIKSESSKLRQMHCIYVDVYIIKYILNIYRNKYIYTYMYIKHDHVGIFLGIQRSSILEIIGKGTLFSLVHAVFQPIHSHLRVALGLTHDFIERWGACPACDGHVALLGSIFLCPRLDVCSLFCLRVCILWPSGMPLVFCISESTEEGSGFCACRRRGGHACHHPASVLGGDLMGTGAWSPLLKLMLLCLSCSGVNLVSSNTCVIVIFRASPNPGVSWHPGTAAPGGVRVTS